MLLGEENELEITEVKVKLIESSNSDRLQAFCSITIDNNFVIRDLKIIEGAKGAFVAMPSRKIMERCSYCGAKNHLRAKYCNECGREWDPNKANRHKTGRRKMHADIAHPINSECRELIQSKVLEAFEEEKTRVQSGQSSPGRDNDDHMDDFHDGL